MDIELQVLRAQLLLNATERKVLTSGRLMSPEEVRAHKNNDGSRVDSRAIGWAICGEVPEEMFQRLLSGETLRTSAFVFDTPAGTPFLALQEQTGHWAHRFILPIVGRSARFFANSLCEAGIVTSLSTKASEIAAINRISPMKEVLEMPLGGVELTDMKLDTLFEDICNVTLWFLKLEAMAATVEEIQNICLTTVTSNEVRAALEVWHSTKANSIH